MSRRSIFIMQRNAADTEWETITVAGTNSQLTTNVSGGVALNGGDTFPVKVDGVGATAYQTGELSTYNIDLASGSLFTIQAYDPATEGHYLLKIVNPEAADSFKVWYSTNGVETDSPQYLSCHTGSFETPISVTNTYSHGGYAIPNVHTGKYSSSFIEFVKFPGSATGVPGNKFIPLTENVQTIKGRIIGNSIV